MKRSSNINTSSGTPPKAVKLSLLEKFSNKSMNSPSTPVKGREDKTNIWIIKHNGDIVGASVDGAFEAGSYFSYTNISQDILDKEAPYDENGTLKRNPIKGLLVKATDPFSRDRIRLEGENVSLETFKTLCPYLVSTTGDSDGNCKVWLFTALQLIQLQKIDDSVQIAGSFETVILERFKSYFEKSRRKRLLKDSNGKIIRVVLSDTNDAKAAFDAGRPWICNYIVYDLDTDAKVDAFEIIASSI